MKILSYEEGSLGLTVVTFLDENGKKKTMLTEQFKKKYQSFNEKKKEKR